jgi:hypothetical protein
MKMKKLALLVLSVMVLAATTANATPPSAVSDLYVETGYTSAIATFTVPAGATWYEIRIWEQNMTTPGWSGYYYVTSGVCTANTSICVPMTGFGNCHEWYGAVRVSGSGEWSNISNQPHESTRCSPQFGEVECP